MSEQLFRATVEGVETVVVETSIFGERCFYRPGPSAKKHFRLNEVSNLRPVRIVKEGEVVLSGIKDLESRLDYAIEAMKPSWQGVFLDIREQVRSQSKPPRMEPKFGDRFIASYKWHDEQMKTSGESARTEWIYIDGFAYNENGRIGFPNLIDPEPVTG